MHCVVTAGPTIEPLDRVRRLTNASTGRLGMALATFLVERGHQVRLLLSEQAVHRELPPGVEVVPFTTTASLRDALIRTARVPVGALFHVAAVSDFTFGAVWRRNERGDLAPVQGGKISTRGGNLMAELVPTPKLIAELRALLPDASLVGWKYEVDGDRASALAAAQAQICAHGTSGCVANGPAYGDGFGLVSRHGQPLHAPDAETLFAGLLQLVNG